MKTIEHINENQRFDFNDKTDQYILLSHINRISDALNMLALEVAHLLNNTWNNLKDMPAPPPHVVKLYCCEQLEKYHQLHSYTIDNFTFEFCPFCGHKL